MPRFSPSGFFGPSRLQVSHPDPWAHIRVPHLCSVCVCVRLHTPTPTYTLTRVKNRQYTDNTPISPSVKITPYAKPQVPSQTSWTPPPSCPNAKWTKCTYMSAYAHPVASVYANVYADVHNTCLTYTPAHAWCSHLSKCMYTLRKKCTCTRACAPMQRCRRFFAMEAMANLSWVLREYRAGCRLPPALATRPAVPTKPVVRRCSLKISV